VPEPRFSPPPLEKEGTPLSQPAPVQLIGQGQKRPRGRPRKVKPEA
jgi:hypothetical protein